MSVFENANWYRRFRLRRLNDWALEARRNGFILEDKIRLLGNHVTHRRATSRHWRKPAYTPFIPGKEKQVIDLRQEQIRNANEEAGLLIWRLVEQEHNNLGGWIFDNYGEPRALHVWAGDYLQRGDEALPIWPFLDPDDYELAKDFVTIAHALQHVAVR